MRIYTNFNYDFKIIIGKKKWLKYAKKNKLFEIKDFNNPSGTCYPLWNKKKKTMENLIYIKKGRYHLETIIHEVSHGITNIFELKSMEDDEVRSTLIGVISVKIIKYYNKKVKIKDK